MVGGIFTFGRSFFSFFSNFSCRFLNPNIFFSNWNYSFSYVVSEIRNLRNKLKKHYVSKIVITFHCLHILVLLISKTLCNFSAFSLKFQKCFFQSLEQFFSHNRSVQFWKQSTILSVCPVQRLESFVSNYIMFFWLTIVQFAIKRCLNSVLSNKSYHI